MADFFLSTFFWILAIYGLIELIKSIYYIFICTKLKSNGIYMIIAGKDVEEDIECFTRSLLFKIIYSKEEHINNIIFTDLNSKDKTKEIMEKLEKEYKDIKYIKWKNCKELIDSINN